MVLPRVHRSYYVLQQCKRVLAKSQMSVRPSVSDVSPCPLSPGQKCQKNKCGVLVLVLVKEVLFLVLVLVV